MTVWVAIQEVSRHVDADTADEAAELLAEAPPKNHQSNLKIIPYEAIEQFVVTPAKPSVTRPGGTS
jgi:hypothetical protein